MKDTIDGKMSFLSQLESKLAEEYPAHQATKILMMVSDIASGYAMTQLAQEEIGNDELLEYYSKVLEIEGRSPKTIERYTYVLNRMLKAVNLPSQRITVHHLRSYLSKEKDRGISESTLEGNRQVFSAYFNWLQRESMIDRNPIANLGVIKVPKKKKDIYSEIDLDRLNRACNNDRDRAILQFLDSSACRVSEITSLDRNQIDFMNRQAIVHGKGNKERTVFLSDVACECIKKYLDSRKDDNNALFIGKGGRRLQPGGLRMMLNKLSQVANVEHVHPHKFRRTTATNWAKHDMPLQIVQSILGHEKMDTTMKYVQIAEEDKRSAFRRCS